MEQLYIEDVDFHKENFSEINLPAGGYENCRFSQCEFTSSSLACCTFINCEFVNSNLSLVKLADTSFQSVRFIDSKLLGVGFDVCSDFGLEVYFENSNLTNSVFYKKKLKDTIFKNCNLNDVDFTEADLTNVQFLDCNLQGAVFERTKLIKSDFRTAHNYIIDPEKNNIKKASFSLFGVKGLLSKYDIEID